MGESLGPGDKRVQTLLEQPSPSVSLLHQWQAVPSLQLQRSLLRPLTGSDNLAKFDGQRLCYKIEPVSPVVLQSATLAFRDLDFIFIV